MVLCHAGKTGRVLARGMKMTLKDVELLEKLAEIKGVLNVLKRELAQNKQKVVVSKEEVVALFDMYLDTIAELSEHIKGERNE